MPYVHNPEICICISASLELYIALLLMRFEKSLGTVEHVLNTVQRV